MCSEAVHRMVGPNPNPSGGRDFRSLLCDRRRCPLRRFRPPRCPAGAQGQKPRPGVDPSPPSPRPVSNHLIPRTGVGGATGPVGVSSTPRRAHRVPEDRSDTRSTSAIGHHHGATATPPGTLLRHRTRRRNYPRRHPRRRPPPRPVARSRRFSVDDILTSYGRVTASWVADAAGHASPSGRWFVVAPERSNSKELADLSHPSSTNSGRRCNAATTLLRSNRPVEGGGHHRPDPRLRRLPDAPRPSLCGRRLGPTPNTAANKQTSRATTSRPRAVASPSPSAMRGARASIGSTARPADFLRTPY